MGVNVGLAQHQADSLSEYSSTLNQLRESLRILKSNLNNGWQAQEMNYINSFIDSLQEKVVHLSSALDLLGTDIVTTASEIRREEEERAAAAIKARQLRTN